MIAIIGIYNTDTKYLSVGYLGLGQMGSFDSNNRMITRKAAYSAYFLIESCIIIVMVWTDWSACNFNLFTKHVQQDLPTTESEYL